MKKFPEIKRKFGFGCMRLPMDDKVVDDKEFTQMVDAFIAAGFNYFDTAHGYLNGESEKALRRCLTSRYPRDAYLLADKLTGAFFKTEEEVRPLFAQQLEICGVDYFDFYLMHSQNRNSFQKFKNCRAYETAFELKAEGRIRHLGISFHDTADILEQILTEYPELEFVQLQINYADWESPSVQSRLCYEVCRRHGKSVMVMEPVRGGNLANLPAEADKVLRNLGGGTNASYALRYVAGLEGVEVVLSGMSTYPQLEENVALMTDPAPLGDAEKAALNKVCAIFQSMGLIPCTGCEYCLAGCPQSIQIPDIFSCYNSKAVYGDARQDVFYGFAIKDGHGRAADCVECGQCEEICPQHLEIRSLLKKAAEIFDK